MWLKNAQSSNDYDCVVCVVVPSASQGIALKSLQSFARAGDIRIALDGRMEPTQWLGKESVANDLLDHII